MLLAIFDDCANFEEIERLNAKVLKVLNGRKCSIVSSKFGTGAEAIASNNGFEFIYSWKPDSKFGNIIQMVCSHPSCAVIFTNKNNANEFMDELKTKNLNKKVPIKLWEKEVTSQNVS